MNTQNKDKTDATHPDVRDLSPLAFASLGVGAIAYVKPIIVDEATAFAVHAADGHSLAVFDDLDDAIAVTRQNDLEPLSVH